jgi:hypothetical protein
VTTLTMRRHAGQPAVRDLPAATSLPGWAAAPGGSRAAIRSADELPIVCAMAASPPRSAMSVCTLPTFHTNWVLVPSLPQDAACRALQRAGHTATSPGEHDPTQDNETQHGPPQVPGGTPR